MSKPRIIASGPMGARELDDGVYSEMGYQGLDGLFEPAMVAKGASISTFDGPVRVRPQATYYEPRTFSLYGYLIGGSGQAEMDGTAHDFFQALSGPNTRFHVGSLYLDCNVTARPRYDRFRDFTTRRDYRLECEAIPALWGSEYHQSVGADQGILVRDDRLDHASIKMTDVTANGREVQFTYGGSAPTRCALMISGVTSGTTYYIVNPHDGRAVAFTPSAAVHYLPSSAGPWLYPASSGANVLRLQSDTSGTLVSSGTYLWALVPSAFTTRYLGNDGNKMTEGPVFSFYRRGAGYYIAPASTSNLVTGGDFAARIGVSTYGIGIAGAGLLLEQLGVNLTKNNRYLGSSTTGWTSSNSATLSCVSASITLDSAALTAMRTTIAGGQTAGVGYQEHSLTAGTVYSISVMARIPAGVTGTWQLLVWDSGWNPVGTPVTISERDEWVYDSMQITPGSTASYKIGVGCGGGGTPADYSDQVLLQVEASPFPTSHIVNDSTAGSATRNADYAALYRPHNYLKYSRDLTQTSAWTVASGCTVTRAGTVADGTASGSTVTFSATPTDDQIYQTVTPDCRPNSTPWTAVVALRQGTLTGSNDFYLRVEDQGGTLIGSAITVTASDLSATETRTYFVPVTAAQVASDDTGLRVAILGKTGAGTVIVESVGLLKGSFPGAPAHTEGSAIPLPQYGYDWPDWITQNGYVEFDAVLPPISTGLLYYVVGGGNLDLLIQRLAGATADPAQYYLEVNRAVSGAAALAYSSGNQTVGNIWDGAAHTLKLWWRNYTLGGTQYMTYGLDVDGVNKYTSGNLASATVTSWTTPERFWLSGGNVMATLRDPTFGAYAVPAGAIPAT